MMAKIEGLILAAGLSTRFKRSKISACLSGRRVIDHVLTAAIDSKLNRIKLIVSEKSFPGSHKGLIQNSDRVKILINQDPSQGMSYSLKLGLREVCGSADGIMIILGDQPLITKDVINILIESFMDDPGMIVRPTIQTRPTTPVIFPMDLYDELMQITGDIGARNVVDRHIKKVSSIEMADFYNDMDIDTEDDLARLERLLSNDNRSPESLQAPGNKS